MTALHEGDPDTALHDARYRAVAARDARFDGVFFTAVRTTGIYCRPSCPAVTPKPGNVVFTARQLRLTAPASGPADVAVPTPCPARRSGTTAPTPSDGRCG